MQHVALGVSDRSYTTQQGETLKGIAQGVLLPSAMARRIMGDAIKTSRQLRPHLQREQEATRMLLECSPEGEGRLTIDGSYEPVLVGGERP